MRRALGWLGIILLAVSAQLFEKPWLRAACVPVILLLLGSSAPSPLRHMLLGLAIAAAALVAFGFGEPLLDATPALIAGIVAWLFARTLLCGRQPLIARAVLAMDGPALLEDPAVVRYTRRLTALWAFYQATLALIALLLAVRARYSPGSLPLLPGPRVFGVIVLPLAIAALIIVEFTLRPRLLPQAPPRSLPAFARELVRSWPALLAE